MGIHEFGAPDGRHGFFLVALFARLAVFAFFLLIPWIIGFTFVLRDARRRGQPGWLWALTTLFLGWVAILAYLIARAVGGPTMLPPRADGPPAA